MSDGTYTYAYDAEGNRTAKFVDTNHDGVLDSGDTDITQYTWDNRNRLVEVTNYATFGGTPTQVVDEVYDVENRWIGEKVDSNGDGVVDHQTRFAYDGNQIVVQFDKEGAGDVVAANLSHRYLWGPAVDQLLADEQVTSVQTPGNVVLPLANQLGTINDLATTQTGVTTVANHRVFDSFGKLESQTNAAVECLFGYDGRPTSTAIGLVNDVNRWEDPQARRWASKDPIGLTAGDPNPSRYVGNEATYATDPSGEAVYLVNRWLEVMRQNAGQALPKLAVVSHTFVYTTNPDGSLLAVYSWGDELNDANNHWSNPKGGLDWNAAQDDIKNRTDELKKKDARNSQPPPTNFGKAIERAIANATADAIAAASKKGEKKYDDSYNWAVGQAFDLLQRYPAAGSGHPNFVIVDNCKTEAAKLLSVAGIIHDHGNNQDGVTYAMHFLATHYWITSGWVSR